MRREPGAPELPRRSILRRWWGPLLLGAWTLVLCFAPDPHPLGAPDWAVRATRAIAGVGEPAGRAVATLALRAAGLAVLGALLVQALGAPHRGRRNLAVLALAPLLAVGTLWVNLGYFPIAVQIQIAAVSAITGAVAWLALPRRPLAGVVLLIAWGALFLWGTNMAISDELDDATRAVGRHLLDVAAEVPGGDGGFSRMLELAFQASETHAPGGDPLLQNRAAILALAVVLGEEQVASIAQGRIDPSRLPAAKALRRRITLQGRGDWSQHFWVSAGLTLLADSERSIAVGLTKELMDATPGGSGFSFADLAADAAGDLFAHAATRDRDAARAWRTKIRAGVRIADFVPELRDLPEGLSREELQADYGGLGGARTERIVDDIRGRLAACPGLR